jgi:hypothetical protein
MSRPRPLCRGILGDQEFSEVSEIQDTDEHKDLIYAFHSDDIDLHKNVIHAIDKPAIEQRDHL